MIDINYTIEFYSYWHCGSGQGAGAAADALVIKDKNKLPYIPGKTIKGLVREAVEDFSDLDAVKIVRLFGTRPEDDGAAGEQTPVQGSGYFTNATLDGDESAYIRQEKLQAYLYKNIASTQIDEKTGTACDGSLRTLEVTVPCRLHGQILHLEDADTVRAVTQALAMIKRLGVNRNRGLGRCDISVEKKGGNQ